MIILDLVENSVSEQTDVLEELESFLKTILVSWSPLGELHFINIGKLAL